MAWPSGVKHPRQWRDEVLSGKIHMTDAPESIQSWVSKDIFDAALQICKEPDKTKRQTMLLRIPEIVRPYVETEAKSLWEYRKSPRP